MPAFVAGTGEMTVGLEPIDASHEKQKEARKSHEGIAAESRAAIRLLVKTHTQEGAVALVLQLRLEVQQLHFDFYNKEVAERHSVLRDHLISAFPPTAGIPRP